MNHVDIVVFCGFVLSFVYYCVLRVSCASLPRLLRVSCAPHLCCFVHVYVFVCVVCGFQFVLWVAFLDALYPCLPSRFCRWLFASCVPFSDSCDFVLHHVACMCYSCCCCWSVACVFLFLRFLLFGCALGCHPPSKENDKHLHLVT